MNVRIFAAVGIAALFLAALIVFAFVRPAGAQEQRIEPHGWIQANPNYKAPNGSHCCSAQHCRPAEPGELMATGTGWLHLPTGTELERGIAGIYPTLDSAGRTWVCVWPIGMACIFPGGGT